MLVEAEAMARRRETSERAVITRWLGNGAIARTPAHIGGPMNSLTIHDKVELLGIACLTVIGLLLLIV